MCSVIKEIQTLDLIFSVYSTHTNDFKRAKLAKMPRKYPAPRYHRLGSVADMPPKMRLVCEQLCAGRHESDAARALDMKLFTFRANFARARAFTSTHSRAELVEWCKTGGNLRNPLAAPSVATVPIRNADGLLTDVLVDSAFQVLMEVWPERFLANAARMREKREKETARRQLQELMDAANAADEARRARQHPAAPGEAATDQPAPNAGTSAPGGLQPGSAR